MKTILIGIPQKIYLDQTNIAADKTIKLSIVDEDGKFVLNNSNAELKDISLTYESETQKYFCNLTINESQVKQYARLFFFSNDTTISQDYYPEDAYLDSNVLTPQAEIVLFQFFKSYYIDVRTKMDFLHQQIIEQYLTDRKGLQSKLAAAQNDIEIDLEMYLTPREKTEIRDNYLEQFSQNFWQFQVSYPPIIELKEFKIMIGDNPLVDINKNLFSVNKQMGTIEFVPFPTESTAGYFSYLLYGSSALATISIYTIASLERIPNMFHCKYTCGLFHKDTDPIEKEGIRNVVARRGLMKILGLTDPKKTTGQGNESLDGASASENYIMDKLFKEWEDDEKKWLYNMKKRYRKLVNVGVA